MAFLTLEMTGDVDLLPGFPAPLDHILSVHEQDPPMAVDTSVPVVQTVNRGVVLIVASKCHEHVLPFFDRYVWQTMCREVGFFTRR